MFNNNTANISVAKPKVGGSIKVAPLGTPIPESALAELNPAFENLGYISDAGLTNSSNTETQAIKEWGGSTVMNVQVSKEDTFQYSLIEALNINVLKHVYGDENVTGDLTEGVTIISNNSQQQKHVVVIDMVLQGGYLKRIVIPKGSVTNVDTITYAINTPIAYTTTLFCAPDENEVTHYEYIQKPEGPIVTHTVTFDSNGGTAVTAQVVEDGTTATEPADPTKTDYTFGGWYKEDTFVNEWDFENDIVTEDITLYAKWES